MIRQNKWGTTWQVLPDSGFNVHSTYLTFAEAWEKEGELCQKFPMKFKTRTPNPDAPKKRGRPRKSAEPVLAKSDI